MGGSVLQGLKPVNSLYWCNTWGWGWTARRELQSRRVLERSTLGDGYIPSGDTCKDNDSRGAWRHDASARRFSSHFCLANLRQHAFLLWIYMSTMLWWYLKDRLPGVFFELWLGMVSLELWLGIEGKHVVFLELWLRMTSLELWLKMADEHEKSFSCGSNWQVLPV